MVLFTHQCVCINSLTMLHGFAVLLLKELFFPPRHLHSFNEEKQPHVSWAVMTLQMKHAVKELTHGVCFFLFSLHTCAFYQWAELTSCSATPPLAYDVLFFPLHRRPPSFFRSHSRLRISFLSLLLLVSLFLHPRSFVSAHRGAWLLSLTVNPKLSQIKFHPTRCSLSAVANLKNKQKIRMIMIKPAGKKSSKEVASFVRRVAVNH